MDARVCEPITAAAAEAAAAAAVLGDGMITNTHAGCAFWQHARVPVPCARTLHQFLIPTNLAPEA